MSSAGDPGPGGTRIISVSASSKKAGKSRLASHLVRELNAEYALKVSSGGRHAPGEDVVTDAEIISRPGTDTGALVEAGARTVLWVCADGASLTSALESALSMLPSGGLLVIEGNSALLSLDPDFAVFLMAAPFEEFKESAPAALVKADLVIVDLTGRLAGEERSSLERGVRGLNSTALLLFYTNDKERLKAFEKALRMARTALERPAEDA